MAWITRTYSATANTWIETFGPWDLYYKARLSCADGKYRTTCRLAREADTYFSVPCAIRYKGKTVLGYLTTDDGENVFHPVLYGKNYAPELDWRVADARKNQGPETVEFLIDRLRAEALKIYQKESAK